MWKQKPKYFRIGFTAAVLALQFLAFTTPALADPPTNNAPANNAPTKPPGATYVGRGVESSIRALLCAPTPSNATVTNTGTFQENAQVTDNQSAGDLATCVNKGYRFALAFGAVASVFFVVLAGYMYMVGGEHGKEQAKEILVSVLAGFLIMLSSYVLLRQINPTLVAFRSIQPPQLVGKYSLPSCADAGLGENCVDAQGNTTTGGGSNGGPGQTQGIKFLIIGDSLSVGLKPQFKTLIAADGGVLVNRGMGEDPDNRGGTTITQWANSFAAQSLDYYASNKPSIVVISLGTNDANGQHNQQQVKTDTAKLIQVLQSKGVGKIIWIGPPKFTSTTSEGGSRTDTPNVNNTTVQTVIAGIKSGQSGCYYDTYSKNLNIFPQKYNGIHPGGDGYGVWAKAVWTSYKTSGC